MLNSDKVILDLCGGTGSWSAPYKNAGYDVRVVTLPGSDVRLFEYPGRVYGILAAPVCTDFSGSGAQYWTQKDLDGRTLASLAVADACCRVVLMCNPVAFWVLENPVGRLRNWYGPPVMYFNPCDYGDAYTKKTCLWGKFNRPVQNPVEPVRVCSQGSWLQKLGGKSDRTKELRSVTPPGFAQAFFESNK
jgi:hypothetical protein